MIDFISNYWQEALYALLSFSVCFSAKEVTRALNRVEAISRGTKAALYNALFQEHRRITRKGYITLAEKKNIEHIYDGYHGLDGNSTGTSMYEELMGMKIRYDSAES